MLWEHHSIQIFVHTIFFLVTGPGTFGRTDQKKFRYDQRSSNMILVKPGNFGGSKLLWAYNGSKFIFGAIFCLCDIESKSCFIWASISYEAEKFHENPQNGNLLDI